MRLQEIMSTRIVTVDPDEAADIAWSRMQREGIRHLIVTEGARLIGVLSERDLGGRKGDPVRRGRTVRELMTPQATSAAPATTLRQAANLMRGRLIGSLPRCRNSVTVQVCASIESTSPLLSARKLAS